MSVKVRHFLMAALMALSVLLGGCSASFLEQDGSSDYQSGQEGTAVKEDGAGQSDDGGLAQDIDEDGQYTAKEDVAAYLHLYGHLPDNFITKKEAQKLGWDNKKGNLSEAAPGKSIGGDHFGNYEGKLPKGKEYHECDINSDGGYRGAERIVYSDDGCIYYTKDHYETFELLYGEE